MLQYPRKDCCMKTETALLTLLKPYHDPARAEHDRGYLNTQLQTLGCAVPSVRRAAGEMLDIIEEELSHREIRKELNLLFKHTQVHEVASVCLFYFGKRRGKNTVTDWRILKTWSNHIDNWAHADWLASLYADLFERFPSVVYPELQAWNADKNPWKRRLSLTSLLYYSRDRTRYPKQAQVFPLIAALIGDKDPYVQKAVGWQLREAHNIWPEKTKAFIDKHLLSLAAVSFSYATEKWNAKEKQKRKEKRLKARRKS